MDDCLKNEANTVNAVSPPPRRPYDAFHCRLCYAWTPLTVTPPPPPPDPIHVLPRFEP